jgi:hypothetical protein
MGNGRALGFLLATVTLGTLVAIGMVVAQPKRRTKRLVNRLENQMEELENRLRLAVPKASAA